MLHLRITSDEGRSLNGIAGRCDKSSTQMATVMLKAAIAALKDYHGPIVPLTLEFPHKVSAEKLQPKKK